MKRGPKPDLERVKAMESLYREGQTLQQVADAYGLTRERVRQLINRQGSGMAALKDTSRALRTEQRGRR